MALTTDKPKTVEITERAFNEMRAREHLRLASLCQETEPAIAAEHAGLAQRFLKKVHEDRAADTCGASMGVSGQSQGLGFKGVALR